jgi:hypothetical protein
LQKAFRNVVNTRARLGATLPAVHALAEEAAKACDLLLLLRRGRSNPARVSIKTGSVALTISMYSISGE